MNTDTFKKYLHDLDRLDRLTPAEKERLKRVAQAYPFRAHDYYLSLIDWDDPDDPIRRLIVPAMCEMEDFGKLDPSDEQTYTVMPGVEHKYSSTVLLLVSNVCAGICRYCFRKRVFINKQQEYLKDIPAAVEYIRAHPKVTNVLLTGGDPLMLATRKLYDLISQIREIDHVQIIRIGTKVPAFNPSRILDDPDFAGMLKEFSTPRKKLYIMTHFSHPRELTDCAIRAVDTLQKAGAIICNQTPLINGVNDDPQVLAELLAQLSFIGAVPYYIFQCRPAVGNKAYTVPIELGYEIVEQAKAQVSGLAKRIRFVMSHATGKIEIAGRTQGYVYFKYHRAADDAESGRFMIFKSNPDACWLEDYDEMLVDDTMELPYRVHGPQ